MFATSILSELNPNATINFDYNITTDMLIINDNEIIINKNIMIMLLN